MAEETITILRIGTDEAVTSVNDLKENIALLKKALGDLEIGSEDYQNTLKALNVNQAALKNAMNATTASIEDVSSAAMGMSESYNGLVNQMANLKRELRATDVSTDAGKEKFKQLAAQINTVNDRLKEMDALQGNYQRNVGNYKSALEGFHAVTTNLPPALGGLKKGLDGVDKSMKLMSVNPVFGVVALLSPMLTKIIGQFKESENGMASIKKAMESLQPAFDLVKKVMETLVGWVGKAVDYFAELTAGSGDTFKNIVAGAVGVGNTMLQFVLTPIRTIIEAAKGLGQVIGDVFRGEFKKAKEDASEALGGIKDAFVKGFSFRENFNIGKEAGEQFAAGLGASKPKVVETATEVVQETQAELLKVTDAMISAMDRSIAAQIEANKRMKSEMKDIDAWVLEEEKAINAEIDAMIAEEMKAREAEFKRQEEMQKARIESVKSLASATSSILGSIADAYENAAGEQEGAANRVKGLRIAAATIETISGAIAAFMSAQSLPFPLGQIVGAAQAAAVTAVGIAQIAKIRSTKVGNGSSSSASSPSTASAFVSAPAVTADVQQVRTLTGASEEERLNQMASKQKVYLVTSELEATMKDQRVALQESTF